jgi:hypothetical protein
MLVQWNAATANLAPLSRRPVQSNLSFNAEPVFDSQI